MPRPVNLDSVRQTAKRLGVKPWMYQKYMRGESLSPKTAKILADRMNVSIESLNVTKRRVCKTMKQKRPTNSEFESARRWNENPKHRTIILDDAELKYNTAMGR